jgi:undecaprenyl-diphosphatase
VFASRVERAAGAIAITSTVTFAALAVSAARTGVFPIDRAVQAWVQQHHPDALVLPMRVLAVLASGYALLAMSAVGFVLLRRRKSRFAPRVPAIALGALLFEVLAKRTVSRPRPGGTSDGFPSGHVLGATVFLGVLAWLLWTRSPRSSWRGAYATLAPLLIVAVAYCRLYLNVHWLSDVVGGFAGGLAYVLVILLLAPELTRTNP